jgi:hypothetical protein
MSDIRAALTVADLAKATGKHRTTVAILIDRGELPGYKTSMGYVIPWHWFDDWQHGRWVPRSNADTGPKNVIAIHQREAS